MLIFPNRFKKQKETNNLATLDKNLKLNVYGQDNAIEEIVDKILVAQAGLKTKKNL